MNEVFRQEKKYLLTAVQGLELSRRLSGIMLEDRHNGTTGYQVRSLYFDTLDDTDYFDKRNGLELRRKMRLRCYSPDDDFAMLEMKQKEGAYQKKRSLRMARADASRLIARDYAVLLRYDEPFAAECYGVLQYLCYRPKTIVEYQRKAFIARENHIRVTLDQHLVATEAHVDLFARNLAASPVLDSFYAILEVKYDGFLLGYLKSLLNMADRSALSVSKYCLARTTLCRPM